MTIATRTHRGNVREANEDSLFAEYGLLMVADGMGGHRGGATASAMAVETIQQETRRIGIAGLDVDSIDALMQETNRRIFDASCADAALQGMGTTATLCILRRNILICAHIGDSRAYLYRNGRLSKLTRDHSLVEELVRSGYITREQAEVHPHRHIVTRALGTDGLVRVDQKRIGMQPDDLLLLCTDGVTLHIPDEEMETELARDVGVEQLADGLLRMALDRGGEDNISLICTRIERGDLV